MGGAALQWLGAAARSAWRALRASATARLLAMVVGPLAASALALKAARLWSLPGVDLAARLQGLVADALVLAGVAALGVALLGSGPSTWGRRAGLLSLQLVALLLFAVDVLAFGYFRATGAALDSTMFVFSLGRASETAPVVASEITPGTAAAMVLVPLWILVAPWLFARPLAPNASAAASRRARWLLRLRAPLALLAACGCVALSARVAVAGLPASVVRDPAVHLALGYLAERRARALDPGQAPPPRHLGPRELARGAELRPRSSASSTSS